MSKSSQMVIATTVAKTRHICYVTIWLSCDQFLSHLYPGKKGRLRNDADATHFLRQLKAMRSAIVVLASQNFVFWSYLCERAIRADERWYRRLHIFWNFVLTKKILILHFVNNSFLKNSLEIAFLRTFLLLYSYIFKNKIILLRIFQLFSWFIHVLSE